MRRLVPLLLATALVLTGCATHPTSVAPPPTDIPALDAERVAVVGDSITTVYSPDFSAGRIDPTSWVNGVLDDDHVFAGGWAVRGASTEAMRAAVGPLDADTLIILAGTNDLRLHIPFRQSAKDLEAIVKTVGADRVVVSAIPPYERIPGSSEPYNEKLAALAAKNGWEFVDPMRDLERDGRFRAGLTDDGVHPTAKGSRILGEAMRAAVWPSEAPLVQAAG